jgi:Chaperone of endosialidase
MTYAVETLLNPRSFVYSSNQEALVLQSVMNDTRLSFINSTVDNYQVTPRFILSASNEDFLIIKNSNVLADFSLVNGEPRLEVPGRILGHIIEIPSTHTTSKAVVLRDYNPNSTHQFAGIGFTDGQNVYQTPSGSTAHIFQAAMDALSSRELMRIQTSPWGQPQVGIATNATGLSGANSNLRLRVGGDTKIDGGLTVSGPLVFDRTGIVQVDSNQRISSNILPDKLLYLDNTNKVDPTYLSQSYQFQFLRGQKNVGIGTKAPLQRFHVQGTSYMSERLGIGTTNPIARLHIVEPNAAIPSLVIQNQYGGNVFEAWRGATNAFTIVGTHSGVGIGTTVVSLTNALEVFGGNATIHGTLTTSNTTTHGLASMERIHIADTEETYVTQQDLNTVEGIKRTTIAYTPFQFRDGLSTSQITALGLSPFVYFKDCGVRIDGDLILGSQMYVLSDARIKSNATPIVNSLQRIERMHGYTYTLPSGKVQAGLLAQEVIDVLPEAVTMLPTSDYYAVSYDSIVPLLVEAVRDLSKQVRDLKKQSSYRR